MIRAKQPSSLFVSGGLGDSIRSGRRRGGMGGAYYARGAASLSSTAVRFGPTASHVARMSSDDTW